LSLVFTGLRNQNPLAAQPAKPIMGITLSWAGTSCDSYDSWRPAGPGKRSRLQFLFPLASPISHAFIIIYCRPGAFQFSVSAPLDAFSPSSGELCLFSFSTFLPFAFSQFWHFSHLISLSNLSYCSFYWVLNWQTV